MTYTLSEEDFSKLSNARIDLMRVIGNLESVIHPNHITTLSKTLDKMTAGLAACENRYEANYDAKSKHYEKVGEENGLRSIWSNYDVPDLMAVHDYDAPTHVVYKNHWGKEEIAVPILGNTWLALWRAADTAIQLSGDTHHIFVEDFEPDEENTSQLILHTGS